MGPGASQKSQTSRIPLVRVPVSANPPATNSVGEYNTRVVCMYKSLSL